MFDIPVDNAQSTQEYVLNESKSKSSNEALYQMSEVDLSFCDALAGLCSGSSSSGPVSSPTTKQAKRTTT